MTGLFQKIETWVEVDLPAWLNATSKVVVPDVVAALAPIAQEAVSELLPALVASGSNTGAFTQAAGQILILAAKKAEAAAIQTTGHDILSAVSAAIANVAAPTASPIPTAPAPTTTGN